MEVENTNSVLEEEEKAKDTVAKGDSIPTESGARGLWQAGFTYSWLSLYILKCNFRYCSWLWHRLRLESHLMISLITPLRQMQKTEARQDGVMAEVTQAGDRWKQRMLQSRALTIRLVVSSSLVRLDFCGDTGRKSHEKESLLA